MKKFFIGLCALCLGMPVPAQTYVPTEENLKSREEFQDDKFGLFIHWGVYSMLADGEWIMNDKKLSKEEYAKLPSGFYPSKFNASEWVAAVKDAGMKYITFTSRHHDGFSMWHTKQSDYNIVEATPWGRDVIKELAEECRKQGIKLQFYYSHLDWYRPDYYPYGWTGHHTGRPVPEPGNWERYLQFMNDQLTELLTEYGPIRGIWFDGWWDQKYNPEVDWKLERQYKLIHDLQPGCLIGNNHHVAPFPGEDFQMFERDLPGQNTAGHSEGLEISSLPLETCQTMNGMWGYKITDQDYKDAKTLIHWLVQAAGNNANLLLNVGPQPNGEIPATALHRMKEIGEWMRIYGKTIYGTRGGTVSPRDWGVTTQKDNKLYVHILNLEDAALFLPVTETVKKATVYKDNTPVTFTQDQNGLFLKLAQVPTDIDYVVELEF